MAIEKAQTRNYDLFRRDADFVAIVLSDEDERSTGPSSATHPEEVIKKVSQLLPGKMFTAYGVILEPGDSKCYQEQGNGEYGDFVYDLVKKTGGKTSSVCAKDYGQGLKEIGERVSTIANSIQLAHEPIQGSISLEVTPYVALNYEINWNKIIFTSAPPSGTEIKVTYLEK